MPNLSNSIEVWLECQLAGKQADQTKEKFWPDNIVFDLDTVIDKILTLMVQLMYLKNLCIRSNYSIHKKISLVSNVQPFIFIAPFYISGKL